MNSDVTNTILLSSVSVESPPCDSFLRLFRNYVYYHFIFPKINKRGGWNRSGGLENFSKINKREGRLFGTREYMLLSFLFAIQHCRDDTMGSERQWLPHGQYEKTRNVKLTTTTQQAI